MSKKKFHLNKIKLLGNKNGLGNKSNLGRKLSQKQIEKIRQSHKGFRAYNWKGNKVSYSGLHKWLYRELEKPNK